MLRSAVMPSDPASSVSNQGDQQERVWGGGGRSGESDEDTIKKVESRPGSEQVGSRLE